MRADPALGGSQAKVDLILTDGATLSAFCEHPLGAFENPLSRAQVEQKFRLYAAGLLPDARIEGVIDAVNRLEAFASVRELMALLCVSPRHVRWRRRSDTYLEQRCGARF
jgi:2-methylcitrate dehydratase PrpD